FVAIDLFAAGFGVAIAFVLRFGDVRASTDSLFADLLVGGLLPLAWTGVAALNRAYDSRFLGVGTTEFGRVFRTFLHLTVLTAFVSYVGGLDVARGFLLMALPLTLMFSWIGRYGARLRLRRMRRAGLAVNRVLVVGRAASVRALAESMARDSSAGLHVAAACLPATEVGDRRLVRRLAESGVTVLGDFDSVRDGVDTVGARSVAVVAGDVGTDRLRSISWELERSDADLIASSGLTEVVGQMVHVQTVAGLPLLRVDQPEFVGFRRALKGCFDRTVATLALIVLSPLLLGIGLLVRLTSRGPALYRQTRVGLNGATFSMVKFRSMRVGADAEVAALAASNANADGLLFKVRADPRVTRVGRVLRRFSLDELPQLLNVLGGSMSLVGPRPPLPSEVEHYADDVSRRLLVKPGLTGLWQVSGRSDLSWEESVRLDLHYVENWRAQWLVIMESAMPSMTMPATRSLQPPAPICLI
ncbi:MAG: sugar transferase, partial [Actinobacteria bacterium]|nr:sugar transferase [Actinomycetota bacterium]